MENLLTALVPFVNTMSENFWLVVLVVAMLCTKANRLGGLLILIMMVYFGFVGWLFAIIIFITLCTNFLNPRKYYKDLYDQKIQELSEKLNSNVVNINRKNSSPYNE